MALPAFRQQVTVDHGEGYEALISLWMTQGGMDATTFHDGPRVAESAKSLPPDLRRALPTIDAGQGMNWGDLVGLVRRSEPPRGVRELIALIQGMDPLDVKLAMLGFHVPVFRATIGQELFREAAAGNPRAMRRFRLRAGRAERGAFGPLLNLPPELAKERTLLVLEGLPPSYWRVDRDCAALLSESAAQTAFLARRLSPAALVERLTRGIVYECEEPYPELLLVPTVMHRPWSLFGEHETTKLICYPVFPESSREGVPAAELVGLYRALGDETRLRILKRLTDGSATFGQLSRELGLAKSTLHQHALLLRQAGFIRQHLGSTMGLELAGEAPQLDRRLNEFLGRE